MRLKYLWTTGSVFLLLTACATKQKTEQVAIAEPVKITQAETKPIVDVKAKPEKSKGQTVKCLYGKEERIISLDKAPKRCEVFYFKNGEKSQAGWAESNPKICTDVVDKIRSNIEGQGFKCQSDGA